jgi:YjbE family integral membrane protein
MLLADPLFWTALAKIIGVNIVLSGDNAVVIALAARSLPPRQQRQAIRWGAGAAVVLRIVLTAFAVALLALPWLKLAGAVLLLWIGVKLLVPSVDTEGGMHASGNLVAAIRTILVADVVMSLDNVIAVAAAAGGDWILLMIGLAISIPLVVFGATLLVKVMERFPVVITIGAALIGFVAGEMAWEDRAIISVTQMHPAVFKYALAALCAAFVVVMGQWLAQRATSRTATSQHQAR